MRFEKENVVIVARSLKLREMAKFFDISGFSQEIMADQANLQKHIFKLVSNFIDAIEQMNLISEITLNGEKITFEAFESDTNNFSAMVDFIFEYINHILNPQKKTT